jgi:hypothetical protein
LHNEYKQTGRNKTFNQQSFGSGIIKRKMPVRYQKISRQYKANITGGKIK